MEALIFFSLCYGLAGIIISIATLIGFAEFNKKCAPWVRHTSFVIVFFIIIALWPILMGAFVGGWIKSR